MSVSGIGRKLADIGAIEVLFDGPSAFRDSDLQDFEFVLCYKAHACVGIAAWQPDVPLVFQRSESFAKREQS